MTIVEVVGGTCPDCGTEGAIVVMTQYATRCGVCGHVQEIETVLWHGGRLILSA